ncbi:MAG: hypothetical protein R3A79_02410 [Nannocystaceae bacterium]
MQIKLSIDGPRGVVSATRIEAGGADPKLAACCARELARATFPKVQEAKIGALATVRS